ncbi:MAG TPA: MFS transporter [Terriglobales bacterium]|nr:MFS transporter [Terriglobales bacterium]
MATEAVTSVQNSVETGTLGLGEKLAYGVGNFAEQMVFNPAVAFMVYFYTDIVGIAAATVGSLMLVSRVFDLLNPVVGLVVDHTRTRYGKGRPWLLWCAVPFGISAALLFTAPGFGPTGKIVYAFITYNLALTLIYTAIDIPYGAMIPLITSDQHQRTLLSLFRMTLAMVGVLLSFAITQPLVKYFGGGAQGWQRAFMIFGALATVLLLVCFFGTKERVVPVSQEKATVPVATALRTVSRNKYWVLMAILAVTLFAMIGLYGDNIYYCRYFLHDVGRLGPLMTIGQIALIAGMVGVAPVLKRFGKRNSALLGTGIAIIGQILLFLAPENFTVVVIGTVVRNLGSAPLVGTMFAMVADTIEYGEWKSGVRTEGLTYGAIALACKISVGLGSVLVGWILGVGGYVAGANTQPASALLAIKVMFLHLPLALLIVSGVILWVYKLDREYPSIIADLTARRSLA